MGYRKQERGPQRSASREQGKSDGAVGLPLKRLAGGAALGAALILAPVAAQADCREDKVSLKGDWGQAQFKVEVADSDEERATGLMNRPELAATAGMLFVYPTPRQAYFWMRNTLIPLDMIFADETGVVTRVHSNAVPLDETVIDGGADVKYVLEINGGLAEKMGIAPGSVMQNPVIAGEGAAWPCD